MAPTPEQVGRRLRGRFGKPYVWRRVCESTQELARELPEGGVAACDEQTAGRGRRGREWYSPPGAGLLFSLALEPHTAPDRLPAFSLVAAEAVCTVCDPRAMVRWPNDVMIEGRKVAGVLPELRDSKLVVGFGVNVNQTPSGLPEQARVAATSLRIERGGEVDRVELLVDLLDELERRYDAFERDGFTGLDRDELRGHTVQLVAGRRGLCEGVDELGRLIVDGHAHTSAEVERVEVV
ncbi:MAG: BirA family transcriptional regulator [Gaiellales bacterium]|jgi:BirA family biotin operon repressor/biotin-[acetyl-CoA-carboxylase] ligase|nr:BirA family transcriptional regulator [Gaiellales bacterium]